MDAGADQPSEVEVNWEYAANKENPVHGIGIAKISPQDDSLAPRPPSAATVDADGYVQDPVTGKWLGFLILFLHGRDNRMFIFFLSFGFTSKL